MSLEQSLASIATSLEIIAGNMLLDKVVGTPGVIVPHKEPIYVAPPVVVPAPSVPAPVVAPVPVQADIVFTAPVVAAPAVVECSVKTPAELIAHVMASYKALGPVKGALIQGVLQSIGCNNINEVTPDKYAAVIAGIGAL